MIEKKYAKVIDELIKEVQVGVGCSDKYYEEIGMSLMDVEFAYDGKWYVAGYAPQKPAEPEPTNEDISKRRESLYRTLVDDLHHRRQRKQICEEWSDADEANYISEVKRLSKKIQDENPYIE